MVICKYFLQGRCRFGDRCYNEHVIDKRYQYQENSETCYNRSQSGSSYHSLDKSQDQYSQDRYQNNYSSNRSQDRSSYQSPDRYQHNYSSNNSQDQYSQDRYQNNYSSNSQDRSSYQSPDRYQHNYSSNKSQDRFTYHSPVRYPQNENSTNVSKYNQSEDGYGYNAAYDRNQYTWHAPDFVYKHRPSRYDSSFPKESIDSSAKSQDFSFRRESPSPPRYASQNSQNRSSRYDSAVSRSGPTYESNNSSKGSVFQLTKNRQEAFNKSKHEENISDRLEINQVKEDMTAWDEGKQWPFSCYLPFKGHPQFPDFNDISPEELRHEAYEAKKNSNFSAYVTSVSKAINIVKEQRNRLRNPSPKTAELIIHLSKQMLTNESDQPKTVHIGSGFMTENSSEVSKDQSSGFLFGKPTSTFDTSRSSGGFSLGHLANAAPTISTVEMTDNSKSATSQSVFSFIPKKTIDFSFKMPDMKVALKVPTKRSMYTPLDDLTIEEREAFEAPVFVLGKIPIRPPPFELCF